MMIRIGIEESYLNATILTGNGRVSHLTTTANIDMNAIMNFHRHPVWLLNAGV